MKDLLAELDALEIGYPMVDARDALALCRKFADRLAEAERDAGRLDFLERATERGQCPGLIFDDNGHWAVAFDGSQTVPTGDGPEDTATSFFVPKDGWHESVRAAIDAAMKEQTND